MFKVGFKFRGIWLHTKLNIFNSISFFILNRL